LYFTASNEISLLAVIAYHYHSQINSLSPEQKKRYQGYINENIMEIIIEQKKSLSKKLNHYQRKTLSTKN